MTTRLLLMSGIATEPGQGIGDVGVVRVGIFPLDNNMIACVGGPVELSATALTQTQRKLSGPGFQNPELRNQILVEKACEGPVNGIGGEG